MNKYLTPKRKEYYLIDFEENVLKYTGNTWGIDNGIRNILIEINKNSNVQTLYSKKCQFIPTNLNFESYLMISYSKNIELNLFRDTIQSFDFYFGDNIDCKFTHLFLGPKTNSNCLIDGHTILGLGCTDNKDYFDINTIRFKIDSMIPNYHDDFWNKLCDKLSKI